MKVEPRRNLSTVNRPTGRSRKRWLDCVNEDTKALGVSDWRRLTGRGWRTLVESANSAWDRKADK